MMQLQYPLVAFVISLAALVLFLRTSLVNMVLDQPNHRSLHNQAIPRIGGLAIMAGLVTAWLLIGVAWQWVAALLLLILVSLTDDVRGLSVRWRLVIQLGLSVWFVYVLMPGMSWWQIGMLVFAIVWMINLYNFMDGSDGLAGGMALFGFSSYALAAFLAGDTHIALMSGCVAASTLAFLLFNFHPARIFMGDAGSVPLGFLAGVLGFYGWQMELWPAWFPVVVFSPFIMDATVTLLKRMLRKEQFWRPHRTHYYQRLVQLGWGHGKTAAIEYLLMMAVGMTALLLLKMPLTVVWLVLALWAVIYLILMRLIDKQWQIKVESEQF